MEDLKNGKIKVARITVVVLILVVVGLVFNAKSWSSLPYSPTDGMVMFRPVNIALDNEFGNGVFGSGKFDHTTEKSPLEILSVHDNSFGHEKIKFCIGMVRMVGKLDPPFIATIRRKLNIATKIDFEFTGFGFGGKSRTFQDGSSRGGNLSNDPRLKVPLELSAFTSAFKTLEPNDPVKINDDLVFIQSGVDLRVYRANSVPPNAKAFILDALTKIPTPTPAQSKDTVKQSFEFLK